MVTPNNTRSSLGLVVLALAAFPATAHAQQAPAPVAPAPAAPAAPAPAAPAPGTAPAAAPAAPPAVAPAAAPGPDAAAAPAPPPAEGEVPPAPGAKTPPPTVFPPPQTRAPKVTRAKPLKTTVGLDPAAVDFGAEADLVSSAGRPKPPADNRRWTYAMRGFFRAPMRVGIGPAAGETEGGQLHSPPRISGANSDEWNYIGVAPAPQGQLQLAVSNLRVSGHVILASDIFTDAAYPHLDKMGGFSQAWVTLKAPALFGTSGGMALNVGAFSERFGMAGPYGASSGYYGTYLFGRTHVAGESIVADIDINEDLELVLEHGVGAKVEVVPFRHKDPPQLPYLPDQGPAPQGSTFLHHAHAALSYKEWLTVAGHYLSSWTPDDLKRVTQQPSQTSRLTVFGGEIHTDHPVFGHGYLGYSRSIAKRVIPLSDALQVIHSSNGMSFKENYFGELPNQTHGLCAAGKMCPDPDPFEPYDVRSLLAQGEDPRGRDDSGDVDTLLFQYVLRGAPLLGRPNTAPDFALAVFGMYNHISTQKYTVDQTILNEPYNHTQDRLKFGGELQVAPMEVLSFGLRFDRVMPDGGNADVAYSAISPRVVLHSKWLSREYIILNYTYFMYGDQVRPSEPYTSPPDLESPWTAITKADPHLISLTAMVGF